MEHNTYPHEPGTLYDCEACESRCHCTAEPGHNMCIFCYTLMVEYRPIKVTYREGDREVTAYVPPF